VVVEVIGVAVETEVIEVAREAEEGLVGVNENKYNNKCSTMVYTNDRWV
jgi:hypothetical protein